MQERINQLKQAHERLANTPAVRPEATTQPVLIRPAAPSWEELQDKLTPVVNLPGFMETRVRELYDAGHGAELVTLAEIAMETATKSPHCLFTASISAKSGNWMTRTLPFIQSVWEVRRNANAVMQRLKLATGSFKQVLALAWRLRGTIMRYVGIATEKGTGIRNPAGLFFALTKQPKAAPDTA
jgi:hypothetical protein